MARMVYTVTPRAPGAAVIEMALVPLQAAAAGDEAWSIEREAMGSGWHDSSWMLKKGLDVIEDPLPASIPPEWTLRWWIASNAAHAPR